MAPLKHQVFRKIQTWCFNLKNSQSFNTFNFPDLKVYNPFGD